VWWQRLDGELTHRKVCKWSAPASRRAATSIGLVKTTNHIYVRLVRVSEFPVTGHSQPLIAHFIARVHQVFSFSVVLTGEVSVFVGEGGGAT
jgi:hypothetical protein